jgi:hypothetical protein
MRSSTSVGSYENARKKMSLAFRMGSCFLRYSAVVMIAFALSAFTAVVLLFVGLPWWFLHASTGFIGVFVPSFLAPRISRWFTALFLLGAGSCFYHSRFMDVSSPEEGDFLGTWPLFLFLVSGGALAVVAHWVLRPTHRNGANAQAEIGVKKGG